MKPKLKNSKFMAAVLLLALPAGAQQLKGVTNGAVIAINTTNTVASSGQYIGQSKEIGIEVAGWLVGTNAYTNTTTGYVIWETSVTGTNWLTNALRTSFLIYGTNGSATVSTHSMGGIPFLRKVGIENSGSSPMTNLSISIFPKLEAR